jgi:hypothetical protein
VLVPHPVSATESKPISINEGTTLLDRALTANFRCKLCAALSLHFVN